jgi:two-component system OmpR family sensor kinase
MTAVRLRSLSLRFFGTFAATVLVIWIAVLSYEAVVIQGRYAWLRKTETNGWAREMVIALRPIARDPAQMLLTTSEMVALRHRQFHDWGYTEPRYRLEVMRGDVPLYAVDSATNAPPPPGAAVPSGWNEAFERDPATGVTVRLCEEVLIVWSFALAGTPHQFIPLLYSIPFLLLPAWFSIRRGLRPVRDIVRAIESRSAADLAPLPPSPYRELAPLVSSVNRLMARLSERLARERDFLSDAAHQLKTPLAVIQANADLLADLPGALPADAPWGQTLRVAHAGLTEGVRDAAHVTHQLLALARSDRDLGTPVLATCDLAELLRSRIGLAVTPARTRGITLALQAPDSVPLLLHRESIAALIDNLVDNAVKYSPDGGYVEVVLERVLTDAGSGETSMRLSVRDHGPGIPAALRSHVFERFFRVPGQDLPGSGLGLAIVAQVARKHGAQVTLDDNPAAPGGEPGLCATVEWSAPAA